MTASRLARGQWDVLVVGGGSAGCVLAARLSEDADRSVCLVEAGPDYGPRSGDGWPEELLDPQCFPSSHDWGVGGEDSLSLGGCVIGGSSARNACMILPGAPSDYNEWGEAWRSPSFAACLKRAATTIRASDLPEPSSRTSAVHRALLESAGVNGFPRVSFAGDRTWSTGVAPSPVNVNAGVRWNAAFAYLDPARGRENLSILPGVAVDRVVIERGASVGVVTSEGMLRARRIVLCAGAYLTPAILMRSGIGPDSELRRLGIRTLEALPVGEQLFDHVGCVLAWEPSVAFDEATRGHSSYNAPVVVQAASRLCPPGVWDLQLLSWSVDGQPTGYAPAIAVFNMKPRSSGRVSLRSSRPQGFPQVERGFLTDQDDMTVILEGLSIAQSLVETDPLRSLVRRLRLPVTVAERRRYVHANVRSYFHMSGTCAMGRVVDHAGEVLGVSGLAVADASIMPTIPRANTNLTVLAVAEQLAAHM